MIRKILALTALILYFITSQALAITPQDLQSLNSNTLYYWGNQTGTGSSCGTSSSTATATDSYSDTLDRFLQAIALHESDGNPTAGSPGAASGKYQFEPATWQGYAQAFYQPATQYSYAGAAPEDVQDAVAYLANLSVYKEFNGDPFWMAINWYLPSATAAYPNKNDPSLDVAPAGNDGLTFAEFGNQIAQAVTTGTLSLVPGIGGNSGPISQITLNYENAPDFQTWLAKDGGAPTSQGTTTSGGGSTSGCSAETCSSGGTSSTGPNAAILCEAEKYAGIYYQWGGGHGYAAFRQACPENAIPSAAAASTVTDPGPCATDCSGLVSVAVDAVFNQDFDWAVADSNGQMVGDGSQYWQSIPISEAQAGDIVTSNDGAGTATPGTDGHVEIVEYVQDNTVYTFGSQYTGAKTGSDSHTANAWNEGAWRYVGPGSSG